MAFLCWVSIDMSLCWEGTSSTGELNCTAQRDGINPLWTSREEMSCGFSCCVTLALPNKRNNSNVGMQFCSEGLRVWNLQRGCFWQVEKQQEVPCLCWLPAAGPQLFSLGDGINAPEGSALVSIFQLLFFLLTSESQESCARSAPP